MGDKTAPGEKCTRRKRGRPTSYREVFIEQIEEHLAKGLTVDSFAAVIGVHRDSVYTWTKEYPEFAAAKVRGEGKREAFLIQMGQSLALGSLTYVKAEEPVLHDGKPVYDRHGNMVAKRTYAQTKGSAAAWIFMCKNMLGWTDCHQLQVATQPPEPEMTREERLAEIDRLQRIRLLCGDD